MGPSVAGVAIAALGEGVCFLMNGFCYTATLGALMMMKMGRAVASSSRDDGALADFRDGFRHAWEFTPIRNLLALVMAMSLAGLPYLVLMPAFAKEVLGGGPQTLGLLMAATGVGAVTRRAVAGSTPVGPGAGSGHRFRLESLRHHPDPAVAFADTGTLDPSHHPGGDRDEHVLHRLQHPAPDHRR